MGKAVCVTGASGYIASWLVQILLQRGYTVKATVRNLVIHLKELEGAKERLHLYPANLLEDGSFDSVIEGCAGVFHTASPVILSVTDPQAELEEPAVRGTLNVLKSCSKVASVKRVVVMSSITAVTFNRNPKGPDVTVDETWFSDAEFCKENKLWYALSKTLAEEAARKFAEENGVNLIAMHPGYVIGPLLQPTLNLSSQLIVDLIDGKEVFPAYDFVDVRDVATADIFAFENPSANGRYLVAGTLRSHSEIQKILRKIYPSLNFPNNATENPIIFQVSKKKVESLGIKYRPLEISLKDIIESLKEKKFLDF